MSTAMGPESQQAFCPQCKQNIQTKMEPTATRKTHILALICCLVGLCPCAAALYCTNCARNSEHYCPLCNSYLGAYER